MLPKLRRRRASESSEDRRLINEARELSLREAAAPRSSRGPSSETRRRERSHGRRSRSSSRQHVSQHPETNVSAGRPNGRRDERSAREPSPRIPPGRQIEHQSSLRSLLSISDPAAIQEEIMRQIVEEGLLDGLDLSNIDVSQAGEMIAAAYRQRRSERRRESRSRGSRTSRETEAGRSSDETAENTERRQRRPPDIAVTSVAHAAHPPVSRPHLIDTVNQGHARQRGSASQSSSQTVPPRSPSGNFTDMSSTAVRSETDLSTTSPSNTAGAEIHRMGLSHTDRRVTDPEGARERSGRSSSGLTQTSAPTTPQSAQSDQSAGQAQRPAVPSARSTSRSPRIGVATVVVENHGRPSNQSSPSLLSTQPAPPTSAAPASRPRTSSSTNQSRSVPFTEPSISCNRCGKQGIQYDLHYNCARCQDGRFNLCLRCYRMSKGCLHWYGFGQAALQKFERQAAPGGHSPNMEPPHVLTGHRYLRPQNTSVHAPTSESPDGDPARRLLAGVFCDICFDFANSCYWKCDLCNEGEWGYCNNCVNQGKHCTHPLLPLTHRRSSSGPQLSSGDSSIDQPNSVGSNANGSLRPGEQTPTSPLTPRSASILGGPGFLTIANLVFRPLTFSTLCDICRYPIPPSLTRFHCPKCNNGDYDICASCYTSLVPRGRIRPEDGHQGWRRCLQGHRMVVVGFEDRDGGQRRIVVNDLVGGHALNENEVFGPGSSNSNTAAESRTNQAIWTDTDGTRQTYRFSNFSIDPSRPGAINVLGQFPPDGGVGLRLVADFTFYPAEGATNELCFPKGAEIREAEDINGDWLWGAYCGSKGFLPGNYVHPS